MKRKYLSFLVCLVITISVVLTGYGKEKQDKGLILATATTGGTFYPVGVAIATLTSVKLANKDKITMTAITSAGSGENVKLLRTGEADFAILQALYGSMAWQGKLKYEGNPQKHFRSVTMLWQNVEHFVILSKYVKSGNMSDLKNIKGKKFSIGKRNSGTEGSGLVILSGLGYTAEKDFSLEYLGYSPSANALQNGKIVAMNVPAGPPVSAITQAFVNLKAANLRVLDFTDEQIRQVNSVYPVWTRYVIKSGTYPGQKKAINTIAQPNFLAVRSGLSEDVVYKMVKNIYANLPFLLNIHKATSAMALDKAISGLPMPLHPGAAKFYMEKGLKIPDNLKPQ